MNYFDEYTQSYDMTVPEIEYKYHHSYRVMDNMVVIAKSLNLPVKDIELAKCIGLLHDIGRFEQFTKYHTFKDNEIDHGDYGEKMLRENNALSHFNIDKEDYEVVYTAIRNHNKFRIEDNLSKRGLLFSKMIRDADKLDVLYALGNPDIKWIIKEDAGTISCRVKNAFFDNRQAKSNGEENKNEDLVNLFALAYDIYFNVSYDIIKNEQYYLKIYQRLHNQELFKPYFEHITKYIDERMK